jgi:hypothetical protein
MCSLRPVPAGSMATSFRARVRTTHARRIALSLRPPRRWAAVTRARAQSGGHAIRPQRRDEVTARPTGPSMPVHNPWATAMPLAVPTCPLSARRRAEGDHPAGLASARGTRSVTRPAVGARGRTRVAPARPANPLGPFGSASGSGTTGVARCLIGFHSEDRRTATTAVGRARGDATVASKSAPTPIAARSRAHGRSLPSCCPAAAAGRCASPVAPALPRLRRPTASASRAGSRRATTSTLPDLRTAQRAP